MILSLCSYFTNSKKYDSELCDSVLGNHSSLREEQVSQRNFWLQAGRRNSEQIEVRECLLLFGAESFVFQFAIQKFKDQDI